MANRSNRSIPAFFSALLLCACGGGVNEADLLKRSQDAHGGLETYRSLTTALYKKRTLLYDSSGKVESDITQEHRYLLNGNNSGTIAWETDVQQRVEFEGEKVSKWINELEVLDNEQLEAAASLVRSSQFVLFQPFRLSDPGTRVEMVRKKWPGTDRVYDTIQPIYEDSDDEWWFYIDPSSDLVAANLVKHNGRFSIIENLEYDSSTALVMHKHRKSYFTDSTLSHKLLRAEYFYFDYYLQ